MLIIKSRGLGRRARWTYRCGSVHSDAKPGVLSGRGADGVPSAPKPEKGKRWGDIKPTAKAAFTGKYGGNIKRDAVLTGENVVNVDYLLYIQEKQEIKYIGENWYIYYTALQ